MGKTQSQKFPIYPNKRSSAGFAIVTLINFNIAKSGGIGAPCGEKLIKACNYHYDSTNSSELDLAVGAVVKLVFKSGCLRGLDLDNKGDLIAILRVFQLGLE